MHYIIKSLMQSSSLFTQQSFCFRQQFERKVLFSLHCACVCGYISIFGVNVINQLKRICWFRWHSKTLLVVVPLSPLFDEALLCALVMSGRQWGWVLGNQTHGLLLHATDIVQKWMQKVHTVLHIIFHWCASKDF